MSEATRFDDPQWCEAEYNPRVRVSDFATYAPKWSLWAAATRERHPPLADLSYGSHPREVIDLFRVPGARAACLFIHGGYWRSFSKNEFSWAAEILVKQGITVAVLNYPLCPEVTIADIVSSMRRAVVALVQTYLTPEEKANLVITGHSAGGYLAAAMSATNWTAYGLDGQIFRGVVPVSGVFDVRPLIHTSINEQVRLTRDSAEALTLFHVTPHDPVPMVPIYGADESSEFARHSIDLAKNWPRSEAAIGVEGCNHFSVIEGMTDSNSILFKTLMRLFGSSVDSSDIT